MMIKTRKLIRAEGNFLSVLGKNLLQMFGIKNFAVWKCLKNKNYENGILMLIAMMMLIVSDVNILAMFTLT